MDSREIPRERLDLKDNPQLLSPPQLENPYQCAIAVTVYGFIPHAKIEIEVAGAVVAGQTAGFPEPAGETIALPTPLVAGDVVRARQSSGGALSDWSVPVEAMDHTREFPAGPPRPQINPAGVFRCGIRTGVSNLLAGGNVWVTADGTEVGRIDGCSPHQGVNINPPYGGGQHVRAFFELCNDPSAPSVEEITQPPPIPLPTPGFDPVYAGGEQLIINNIVNGARVTLLRGGVVQGSWGCWGGALQVDLNPPFTEGEVFTATQSMCPGDPVSPPGKTTVENCSKVPAPQIGPVQGGDTAVTVTSSVPGAVIKVYVNGTQAGTGSAPLVGLNTAVKLGDTIVVVQDLAGCRGQTALEVKVACVDPPVGGNPGALDLFPVGHFEYTDGGAAKGSVYYPAEDDGADQPFNARLGALGRVPIVVMAHGNQARRIPAIWATTIFKPRWRRWESSRFRSIAMP